MKTLTSEFKPCNIRDYIQYILNYGCSLDDIYVDVVNPESIYKKHISQVEFKVDDGYFSITQPTPTSMTYMTYTGKNKTSWLYREIILPRNHAISEHLFVVILDYYREHLQKLFNDEDAIAYDDFIRKYIINK